MDSGEATTSICLTGWRLPTSGSHIDNYSFGKLTNAYGITGSSIGSSDSALLVSPLFFARSGNISFAFQSLNNVGSSANYWSSKASSSSGAYNLNFGSTSVYASDYTSKNYGFLIRCVAL